MFVGPKLHLDTHDLFAVDSPTLKGLVRGYFHRDYDIISEDGDEVIAAFRDENLPMVRQSLMEDIHRFLDRYGADEKQLTDAFERVFTPETAGKNDSRSSAESDRDRLRTSYSFVSTSRRSGLNRTVSQRSGSELPCVSL